jgi:Na+/proline symporter
LWVTKLTTALVTLLALAIALGGTQNVFTLVLMSWSILGAAFGPLLFLYTLGKRVNEVVAILMIVNSILVTFLWRQFGLNASVYEAAPGILTGLLTYFLFSFLKWNQEDA